MPYHIKLEKQIEKTLGSDQLKDPVVQQFLELVNNSYINSEKDKKLSEHAFAISEKEYQEVLSNLEIQNDIRHQSIKKLKEAISSLDSNATITFKNDDDELMSVISYLEHQIRKTKELETQLIHAKEDAEKAAKAKSEFLSVMSHEIRTPLNAIIGINHLLLQDEHLPTQVTNLHTLNISAENLLNLINDILDFSKIEEGKIRFSEKNIDIRQLMNNLKLANRIRAEEKGNKIKLMIDEDLPRYVKGDDVRLGQILNNLISNAVKFTKNGSISIEVSLKRSSHDTEEIYFSVTDTGIGIEKDKQALIFERFTQANSEITREFGGSGLGLAIISRLLSLQNSHIDLHSEPGKGSRFSFTLSFRKGEEEIKEEKTRPTDRSNLNGVKVLLVEDVEFNVLVAEKMLTNWNASVELAENGLIAISKARDTQYDIILMDLQMPVMDGYSATKQIRGFDELIPIIALTASASTDIQHRVSEFGMTDYLPKPFRPNDLFDIIFKYTQINKAS